LFNVTYSLYRKDDCILEEAVQDRGGRGRVTKDNAPILDGAIGGNDGGGAAVAALTSAW